MACFFPEHHFHGYSPTGSDAFQLAAYHPAHTVEQMNMLDQLAIGRVLFGLGSGIHPEEGLGFGLDYDNQINSMSTENLEAADKLWDKRIADPALHIQTSVYSGTVFERIVPSPYRKRRATVLT